MKLSASDPDSRMQDELPGIGSCSNSRPENHLQNRPLLDRFPPRKPTPLLFVLSLFVLWERPRSG